MESVILVKTLEEAQQFMSWLGKSRRVLAIDTETTGLNWNRDKLRLVQFGDVNNAYSIAWEDWPLLIKDALNNYEGEVALHNHKFDSHFFREVGINLTTDKRHCTMTLAHLHNPTDLKGLKPLAGKYVPGLNIAKNELSLKMKKFKWDWATIPIDVEEYWFYGGIDCIITARLFDLFYPEVNKRLYDIEMTSQIALEYMEKVGVKIDTEYLKTLADTLQTYITDIEQWAYKEYGINIRSKAQLEGSLLDQGWVPSMFTPTGKVSLSKSSLDTCNLPLAESYTDMKHSEKMLSAFCNNLLEKHENGILHPSINPVGAVTGRMSMSTPNLQQLPRSSMIRDAFLAREGKKLVLCDYDAVELRLFAHYAEDVNLQEASSQSDPHKATAAMIWQGAEVTPDMRQKAKGINYTISYGAGVGTVAANAGITEEEAAHLLQIYKSMFPGVNKLFKQVKTESHYSGEGKISVETTAGRRQYAYENQSYKLVNYLVQGTCADVLKEAISKAWQSDLADYLRLPVHDELVLEVPENNVEEVSKLIEELMYNDEFTPALTAHASTYDKWGDKYR